MVVALVWSQQALDDIGAIAEYISRDSPRHACRVVDAFFEASDVIVTHPYAGRIVPELGNAQIRERFVYSYRLLYEIGTEHVHVLSVIHGRRLLGTAQDRPA